MDKAQVWQVIHEERAALADILETLTPEEWEHPSLCEGWSVRDVAAHVISAPEAKVAQMAAALLRARGSFNRAAHDEAQHLSSRPTGQIVDDYRRLAESRRLAPGTNHKHALLDTLVHTQDIVIPLGRHHEMPVEAARASAEAFRKNLFPFNARKRLAGCRLEATDTDWAAGEGALVRGPIAALLLLITGRAASLTELSGEALPQLRQRLEVRS
jgi:uncharacterized protein (TIGR03083 family)